MIPISDVNYRARFPFVNLTLIAINILVYIYEVSLGGINLTANTASIEAFFTRWAVIPVEYTLGRDIGAPSPHPVFITLFTAMFMHGGLLHIAGNMLYLWVFGDNVEANMGHVKYLIFYLACGIIAGITHILFNRLSPIPSVGASGAIAGVLAAYLVLFPRANIRTLVIFFYFITTTYIPALILIGIWILLQVFQGIADLGAPTAQTGGVAVWAHIGGFVAGLILVFLFRGREVKVRPRGYYDPRL